MMRDQKFLPALIVPPTAFINPFPVNNFSNKLAPNVTNNYSRNPSFCTIASFLVVSLRPFIHK